MATQSVHNSVKDVEGAQLCWQCQASIAVDAHFCPECGRVQAARPLDYFSFFGLPRKLKVDVAELEKEFYRLSRKLHPDVYAQATAREQEWSLEKSSQLNDGYRTLRDPITRTQYLLGLEGIQLDEQSATASDQARQSGNEKKQIVPPELLEEVFELNMQLQELKADPTEESVVAELRTKQKDFERRMSMVDVELQEVWTAWDDAPADAPREAAKTQMVALLNRRSYIRNLVRDVNAALANGNNG